MADRLLEVSGLNVEFSTPQGTVQAVRDVSFHVGAGEVLGIVGESGSGKSISVMSCMGLIAPNGTVRAGRICFDGQDISPARRIGRAQRRRYEAEMNRIRGNEISMIFQDPMTFLNPVLTIGTQVTEGIRAHCKCSGREAWNRGVELLRRVGISSPEKRMKQYPHEFSGGMRQRIIIAIALSCDPKLLIADEPTTALDVTVQAQILDLIRDRTREMGTAVILISHDLGVVASMCKRIMIFYGGRVMEEGTADEIFDSPKHPYTQGLLSSVARRKAGQNRFEPLASIPGTPPDLIHMRAGCPFAARCAQAMKICRDYRPAFTHFSDAHRCACWLYCKDRADAIVAEQNGGEGNG